MSAPRRRNTLISGASSGLGAEMARQLAATGHHLALTARRVDRLEALRDEILAAHPAVEVVVHALDVTDAAQVADVVKRSVADLGGLDRVIVNAGLGKGARIGTGDLAANRETIETNVLGALAQAEAAMEHFYERQAGHLVLVSSMSALRGLPGAITAYAASKAAVASLGEGIRMDLAKRSGHDIAVTTLLPGYIASEMNDRIPSEQPLLVDTEKGVRSMVKAIVKEAPHAAVPGWPWAPLGQVMKHAPFEVVRRLV